MGTAVASLAAIRRLAVSTQSYASRFRRAPANDVEAAIQRLGAVQLDSISTVDRAHRLTLTSRIGAYDETQLQDLLTSGRIFEYWAHEACLLPVELWPHFRRTMEGDGHWGIHDRALLEHAELVEPVLERIRAEGPLASRDFGGTRTGPDMWSRTPAKAVLEALWDRGALVVAGRESFQRRYDLAERVISRAILDAPTPDEDETLRTFALLAVRARGALTEPAIREHWRLKGGRARLHHHVLALVDEGLLREVPADDGGPPFYVDAEAELDGDPAPPVLLCPFDNLLWDRPLLERLFGFRHVIEVYKREHERAYG
ncbi:MAG TPA: crosslink repair DNA glycosylase YcaQ family protein, partial [Gaiellaceae bacterium]|nr:crosslink repair DNA glycosylase YcaQ family protein [Gaiellaceae bacterium]